ncbi:MAG: tetratricopeptide repeat protein [Alistipes sp.]|nr:tetratricopeptide repeat protein [Alistipes sp.]
MARNAEDVSIACNPEVLVLNNGKVEADITVNFPVEYYNKKAVVKVTPVIVFEGGEVEGATYFFQGSKVDDNYTVVDKAMGGKFTQHVEFPYDCRMATSELHLRVEIKCPSGKCKEFTLVNANTGAIATKKEKAVLAAGGAEADALKREFGLVVAKGVNTLQKDLDYADAMSTTANNYKNVTTVVTDAEILYAVNSSRVKKGAAETEGVQAFWANVEAQQGNDRATQNLFITGYASPEGPIKFNKDLSDKRSQSANKAVAAQAEELGVAFTLEFKGEDWDGFQELVAASNIENKDLILNILSTYTDAAKREEEIINLSNVYPTIKKEILPLLRRAQLINSTDIKGKTNEEMKALAEAGKYNELDLEELLYTAESVLCCDKCKAATLEYAAKEYNDARAYNNLGVAYAGLGENEKALAAFEKAAELGLKDANLNNNIALANLANGNVEKAKTYAPAANAETKALIAASEGQYSAAAAIDGYNAAIANVMNNDLTAAKKAIAADKSAKADYLRAVIAVKEGDMETAKAQLNSAISKDEALKEKAAKDINLAPLA